MFVRLPMRTSSVKAVSVFSFATQQLRSCARHCVAPMWRWAKLLRAVPQVRGTARLLAESDSRNKRRRPMLSICQLLKARSGLYQRRSRQKVTHVPSLVCEIFKILPDKCMQEVLVLAAKSWRETPYRGSTIGFESSSTFLAPQSPLRPLVLFAIPL